MGEVLGGSGDVERKLERMTLDFWPSWWDLGKAQETILI